VKNFRRLPAGESLGCYLRSELKAMGTDQKRGSHVVSIAGILGFVLGFLPLVALTFFSPGLRSEGVRGLAVLAVGVITLVLLIARAREKKSFWILVAIQMLLLTGVLIETFSDARLYIGT
jgi:uncharacterized membrane protein HdeD (DUF308 family)